MLRKIWNWLWDDWDRSDLSTYERLKKTRSSRKDLFEDVMWWWCELDCSPTEIDAAEDVSIELGELMGRVDKQDFTGASITQFFRTVDEIKSREKTLGYFEITSALRDAYRQLLISPCL